MKQKISIIIPVLNEESSIVFFLETLQYYRKNGHEIILVDGGSDDNTVNLAQIYVDQTLVSHAGRAKQMNLGARHAKNTILLFLHSDTFLPPSADIIIVNSLSGHECWGRFNIKLSGHSFIFRIIEYMINLRSKYTKVATGDQAIFINKNIFNKIKGYPNIKLMEDIALSKKLRKRYLCACLTEKVITSSRRWEKQGIYRTIILMWSLRFLYYIGVKPSFLYKLYYRKNNTTCCLVFTKNPEPGKTKTRLIPAIGVNGAYKVHIQLLKHTLNITSKIKDIDFQLHHTSVHNNQWLTSLAKENNLSTKIQNGNNLGERMYRATQLCLKKYSHCLIIGTDCPELTEQYLVEANQQLTSGYDAVIGPAYDGGYVLIGLNNTRKEIFSDINWGKSTVFTSTITIFNKLNLKYKILSTLHDVDTKEDLQYLKFLSDH